MEKCSENIKENTEAILAFDTLYTTNHMKILKLLIPYLESETQKKLAIFIKWQELMFTLNFFRKYSASLYSPDFKQRKKLDLNTLIPLLTPYCNESEKAMISQFSQMQNIMNMMDQIQAYMPMIQQFMSSMSVDDKDLSGINLDEFNLNGNNMMDMLKNLMSAEQQTMFSMFMENDMDSL